MKDETPDRRSDHLTQGRDTEGNVDRTKSPGSDDDHAAAPGAAPDDLDVDEAAEGRS